MEYALELLRTSRTLRSDLERWERFHDLPGWARDRVLAVEYDQPQQDVFEIAEVLIAEPIIWKTPTNDFCLSLLINGDDARPMEIDHGDGRFQRKNRPGSIVFGDFGRTVSVSGNGPYHLISLKINREFFTSRLHELYECDSEALATLFKSPIFDLKLQSLIRQLHASSRSTFCPMGQDELLDEIISSLWRNSGRGNTLSSRRQRHSPELPHFAINNVVQYLHENLQQSITREELAKIAGMSPGHFSRAFQKSTGVSPTRFLLNLRLENAKSLLLQADRKLTIQSIAMKSGFKDEAHFYRAFRAQFGVSPAKLREV